MVRWVLCLPRCRAERRKRATVASAKQTKETGDDRTPAGGGRPNQAAPALGAVDEVEIGEGQYGQEVLASNDGYRGADEAPASAPDQQPSKGRADGEHASRGIEAAPIIIQKSAIL